MGWLYWLNRRITFYVFLPPEPGMSASPWRERLLSWRATVVPPQHRICAMTHTYTLTFEMHS